MQVFAPLHRLWDYITIHNYGYYSQQLYTYAICEMFISNILFNYLKIVCYYLCFIFINISLISEKKFSLKRVILFVCRYVSLVQISYIFNDLLFLYLIYYLIKRNVFKSAGLMIDWLNSPFSYDHCYFHTVKLWH